MSQWVRIQRDFKQNFLVNFGSILLPEGAAFLYRDRAKGKFLLDKNSENFYYVRVLKNIEKGVRE